MENKKVINISIDSCEKSSKLYALCEDGEIWMKILRRSGDIKDIRSVESSKWSIFYDPKG